MHPIRHHLFPPLVQADPSHYNTKSRGCQLSHYEACARNCKQTCGCDVQVAVNNYFRIAFVIDHCVKKKEAENGTQKANKLYATLTIV